MYRVTSIKEMDNLLNRFGWVNPESPSNPNTAPFYTRPKEGPKGGENGIGKQHLKPRGDQSEGLDLKEKEQRDTETDTNTPPLKFPRTHHLFNPGGTAVTSDDLLCGRAEVNKFIGSGRTVLVQEKVDGANLGISIDPKDGTFMTQNRSHYVNHATATQWGTLDAWLSTHEHELRAVLEPGRHVLFGEWLRAKHSVYYDTLPDTFLIFDILDKHATPSASLSGSPISPTISKRNRSKSPGDRKNKTGGNNGNKNNKNGTLLPPPSSSSSGVENTSPESDVKHIGQEVAQVGFGGRFLSYDELLRRLEGTTLQTVPEVARQPFSSLDEVKELLETKSRFSATGGFVEGVYLRLETADGRYLESRCKVVRPDFIRGITTHWTKLKLVKNVVRFG